jgi:RNA polymerase sigma-70 factor (ECF subfamily)
MDEMFGKPLPDERLLERARAGDPDALHTLFERHRGALEVRIRRLLPPAVQRRVSISDVLQETRILAFERSGRFEPRREGAYRTWLLCIAERKAREALRAHAGTSKRAVAREIDGDGAREARARDPSPSQSAMAEERRRAVLRAIATLPADQREVLRLARMEGHAIGEVARRMTRSVGAIKKLYGRALVRFAKAYAAEGGEAP